MAKLGYGWTSFYFIRPVFFLYISYRIGKLLVKTAQNQWEGKGHYYYTVIIDEMYYDTWHKDKRDQRMVNFRYSDHSDVNQAFGSFNNDYLKPDAEYAKGLFKHFQRGADSYWDYFTKNH